MRLRQSLLKLKALFAGGEKNGLRIISACNRSHAATKNIAKPGGIIDMDGDTMLSVF
jgi:hypothetical protein